MLNLNPTATIRLNQTSVISEIGFVLLWKPNRKKPLHLQPFRPFLPKIGVITVEV
jgi:hypothetical protein